MALVERMQSLWRSWMQQWSHLAMQLLWYHPRAHQMLVAARATWHYFLLRRVFREIRLVSPGQRQCHKTGAACGHQ